MEVEVACGVCVWLCVQTGDLTFNDFLAMSEAFTRMDGSMPGLPGQLSVAQIEETRDKIEKHQKIVNVMLDEEREQPQMLIDDLKAGGSKPGPRMQRLAVASGQPETEVALFVMQFEAMRESTRRIAAGEDPDEVTESMSAPPGSNRAARRAAKKTKAKKAKSS
uniref:Signal recognition particle SRP54 subunit M-domain domain-containing protein n=1 Tax=Calcidiscus leptoporus TaxID=127549 RepID=A0A7S0P5R3_9EUKA|mmetsp:Transcript_5996/g.13905  ORF Transcript_5996/g.13905 Transcript_5996/m.13905 type:complete len:164 (+) Transcript_5996:781-1272(+)